MKIPLPLRPPLLLAASLSAGIASGWALRQGRGNASSAMPPAAASGASGAAAEAGGTLVEPFSMERFRAASGLPMHRMLAQVLPTADAALVRALAEHLATRPEFPPDPVWQALLARWVQLDAPAALAWARTVERKEPAETAITAWAEADVEAALAGVKPAGLTEWRMLCDIVAETDPKRALEIIMGVRGLFPAAYEGQQGDREISLLSLYARSDPQAAFAVLKAHYPTDTDAWRLVARGWALKDPDVCRDWLAGLQPPFRDSAMEGLTMATAEDPVGVAKILTAVPQTDETRRLFLMVSGKLAEQDAAAAMDWVKQCFPEGPLRNQALAQVARGVMAKDLSTALAIMDGIGWDDSGQALSGQNRLVLPGGEGQFLPGHFFAGDFRDPFGQSDRVDSIKTRILGQLGRTNPELALRYVEKIDPAGQPAMLASFVPQWFDREPEAVTRWLENLPPDRMQASGITYLLKHFSGLEPEAARTWAQRLPPGPLQQALAGLSVERASLENPAAAVEALPFTDPTSRMAALDQIVRAWSATAPRAALDRLVRESIPFPETCEDVVEEWTLHDPTAASTWVAAQAPGPNRDAAIKGLTTRLTDEDAQPDFPAALVWSLSMTDPAGRLKTAQYVLKNGTSSAQEAAEMRATLETTTALPEPERRALLQLLNP